VAGSQHRAWEEIAHSFDRNRKRTWPHVDQFLASLPPGSRVLDLMGGNGRHLGPGLAHGLDMVWTDWSRPAASIVRGHHSAAAAVVADATSLPFADASFDACIFVAGLHSIPTPAGRAACLAELRRILKRGARVQVTVWSRDAPRFRAEGAPGRPFDVVIPWRSDGHDVPRHYHLYTPAALRDELEEAGMVVEAEGHERIVSRDDPDNLVAVARRPG
jgi:SAM-dependent methyltransferase